MILQLGNLTFFPLSAYIGPVIRETSGRAATRQNKTARTTDGYQRVTIFRVYWFYTLYPSVTLTLTSAALVIVRSGSA